MPFSIYPLLRMYPKHILVILLMGWLTLPTAQAQTLDDYLQMAIEQSPALKQADAQHQAARQHTVQQKSLPDPVLRVSALGQMVETRVGQQIATFSVEQMFPWFGTRKAATASAAHIAQARAYQTQSARSKLVYDVKNAYYPIAALAQLISRQQENLKILESYKSLATERLQQGTGSLADVLRIEIMMEDARANITLLAERRRPLEVTFNSLLNRDLAAPVHVPDTVGMPDWITLTAAHDSLSLNAPALMALDQMAAASRLQQEVGRKAGMPTLGIGFSYTAIAKRTDANVEDNGKDAYMPMVSVSLPIYRKKYKARVAEAEWQEVYFQQQKDETVNSLQRALEMERYNITRVTTDDQRYRRQITLARQTIRLLLADVAGNHDGFEEVLKVNQQLLALQTQKINNITEARLVQARLEYVLNR